jgi:hypothetical protein
MGKIRIRDGKNSDPGREKFGSGIIRNTLHESSTGYLWCGRSGPKTCGSPADTDPAPDPQHCLIILSYIIKYTTGYSTCGVDALAGDWASTFTSFFKDKKSKRSHKTVSRNQGFSYYFCLKTEESGSGSVPLTNGSGSRSRRPQKNIRIRRIQIRNTDYWLRYLWCRRSGWGLGECFLTFFA